MRRRRAALRSRIPALAVMIGLAAGLTGFALAGGANGFDNALTYQADASEKPVYESVVVRSGDTIWGLAEAYGDDSRSIRSLVNEICAVNDVAAGDLYPGQVMRIPVASGNYS
jgi:nucleoid-associated protein YgaU